jgi:cephalosporin hydroxylase
MYQFWNDVVAPAIEAAGARRIVDVGALRGENTEQLLDRLGPDVELHVTPPHDPEARKLVDEVVGHEPHALVILGSRTGRHRTRREFESFAPLVPVGSYLVVEHTVLNGFPVDAGLGPGPHEALRRLLNLHGEFLADTTRERHALTCNQGGFLRRTS